MENRNNKFGIFYLSATFLLIFLAFLMSITSISFIIGGSISYYQIIIAFLLSCFALLFKNKRFEIYRIKGIALAIIILVFSIFLCSKFYDFSWDGNTYHKDAVGALKNGWNPIYENYNDFYKSVDYRDVNIVGNEKVNTHGLWQTHYAKGIWYVAANFYKLTNNIESAKIFNLLIVYISIIFVYNLLSKFIKNKIILILISILASISPVVLLQLFTYYNDGALYNCLLLVIITFVNLILNYDKKNLPYFLSSLLICCNIKFTGLAYAGVFCLFLYALFIYNNIKYKKIILQFTLCTGICVLFSMLIVGANPYVKNQIDNGNIFYPLFGKNKVDIVSYNQPQLFSNIGTVKKVIYSIYSESANINYASGKTPVLKRLFTIKSGELLELKKVDLRIGGYGVLFSGIFTISALIMLIYLIKGILKKDKNYFLVLSLVLPMFLLTVGLSESWWSRYNPFIYYFIFMSLLIILKNKKTVYLSTIILTLISLNLYLFVDNGLIENYNYSKDIISNLDEMKKNDKVCIVKKTQYDFLGTLYNFDDRNITFDYDCKAQKGDKRAYSDKYYWRSVK